MGKINLISVIIVSFFYMGCAQEKKTESIPPLPRQLVKANAPESPLPLAPPTVEFKAEKPLVNTMRLEPQTAAYQNTVHRLRLGIAFLSFYEQKLINEGLQTALGLSHEKTEALSYLNSVSEVTFNTYFMVRLILSKYAQDPFVDDLLNDYEQTIRLLMERRRSLKNLLQGLEVKFTPSNPADEQEAQTLIENIVLNMGDEEIKKTPFFQKIRKHSFSIDQNEQRAQGLRIDEFNIESIKKYIGQDRGWELLKQANIMNAFLLVRGPAILDKMVQSRLGAQIGHRLKIPGFINKISQLRWPMNSLFMWVLLETADGCLIRYTYLAFAFDGDGNEDFKNELERYLDDSLGGSLSYSDTGT